MFKAAFVKACSWFFTRKAIELSQKNPTESLPRLILFCLDDPDLLNLTVRPIASTLALGHDPQLFGRLPLEPAPCGLLNGPR